MNGHHVASLRPIPILTYHQIAATPVRGTPFRSLCVTPSHFARQMRMLQLLGYRGLSMGDLLPYLLGQKTGKVVGITFDDGYRNNLEHALPILQSCGFTATCYVVSKRIGKTNAWDEAIGIPQVPLMNGDELRQWLKGGQELGAHTCNHVHLSRFDIKSRMPEIYQCRIDIEDATGQSVDHFCYPYGDFDTSTCEMVRDAGYLTSTTTLRGRCAAGDSLYLLPRVPVLRTTSMLTYLLKIFSAYEDKRNDSKS